MWLDGVSGIRDSYYDIPKAIFYLLEGGHIPINPYIIPLLQVDDSNKVFVMPPQHKLVDLPRLLEVPTMRSLLVEVILGVSGTWDFLLILSILHDLSKL